MSAEDAWLGIQEEELLQSYSYAVEKPLEQAVCHDVH
jgi:hypothetical protein